MRKFQTNGQFLLILLAVVIVGFFIAYEAKEKNEPSKQEKAISEIRNFMNDSSLKIQYANESKFAYDENMDEDIYISEFDQFEINENGKIIRDIV